MASNSRTWSDIDKAAMDFFAQKRAENPLPVSDRALARALGVSAPRVADLFNYRHGVPTLQEFVSLCVVFSAKPSETISLAIENAQRREDSQAIIDVSQLSEDARKEMALKNLEAHAIEIAALEDKNKNALIDRGEIDEP
jgi:AraC-like DNA-binding protein